jgi:hypothetical protein
VREREKYALGFSIGIEMLIDKLDTLTQNHFIAKAQSAHRKEVKENLADNECLILADFNENYTFVLQDAAQGCSLAQYLSNPSSFCCIFQE